MRSPISRRSALQLLPAAAAFWQSSKMNGAPTARDQHVLLGTTGKVSKGIYSASWNASTGELGAITLAAAVPAPSFLAVYRAGASTFVYAVSESGGAEAKVTAFRYDAAQQTQPPLAKINEQSSGGDGPTHVSVSPRGGVLALANYDGGSVTSYALRPDGSLSAPASHFQYSGHGPDASRQQQPHAHSAAFSPDGNFLLVNDLGLDRINVYKVNQATGELLPNDPPFWAARPGSGPRHIVFHPNGHWLYSVNELDSTVDILRWDADRGSLQAKGSVSTLLPDFAPKTAFAGEIVISRDGRNLYVGNRIAADTIAMFDLADSGGSLRLAQLTSNGGKLTRHIALDPTGHWMLLSNQGSGTLVVLERDLKTGKLSEPRHTYPLDTIMFATVI